MLERVGRAGVAIVEAPQLRKRYGSTVAAADVKFHRGCG